MTLFASDAWLPKHQITQNGKEKVKEMKIGIFSIVILIIVSMACIAAENPKVKLDASETPIAQVMLDLGKQAGVQIVCDTDVKATVSGQFESIELEKLLDTITKLHNLKWQKIYITVTEDNKPTLTQIKARAEAVAVVTGSPIVIYDPATGKQKVFIEQDPAAPSIAPDKLGLQPVYLVSVPKAEKKALSQADQDAATYFQSLQNERMKLMANMPSEQRVNAIQQEMQYMLNMDPQARQQMMLDQMNARRTMGDDYQKVMRDTFRSMRDQGLMPNFGRGGRGQGQGRNGGNRNNQNN